MPPSTAVRARLGPVAPFFIVRDIEPSIAFYVEKLGFQLTFKGPADDPYFAIVERDNAWLMLKAITEDVLPVPNHTRHEWAPLDGHAYIPDPDALSAEFAKRGVTFRTPLGVNSDNLRGFEIEDEDGYVLYFGRPVDDSDPATAAGGTALGAIAPFRITADLERAVSFYVDRLGFSLTYKGPEEDPFFAIVERDSAWFMLKAIADDVLPVPNHTRHGWARWDANIYVPDPDTLADEYARRGVPFYSALDVNLDNLRGFEIEDADGYVIYFGRLAKPGDPPIAEL